MPETEEVIQEPAPEQPQPGPVVDATVTPQGLQIRVQPQSINIIVDDAAMETITKQYLQAHPDVFNAMLKSRLDAMQAEQRLLKSIKQSRNDQ